MDLTKLPKLDAFSQHTTVFIEPTKLDSFWQAFTPVYEKTSAVPECLFFEVFEDPAVPGKIKWVVNWNASPEWVMTVRVVNIASSHTSRHFANVQRVLTSNTSKKTTTNPTSQPLNHSSPNPSKFSA